MTFLVRAFSTFSKSSRVIPVANRGFGRKCFSTRVTVCGTEKRGLRAFNTTANKGHDTMVRLPNESEILGKNEGREEALTEVLNVIGECDKDKATGEKKAAPALEKKEEKQEEKKEPELKKLSAAEFRAYNSMAEHMEYFVSFPSPPRLCTRPCLGIGKTDG